MSKELSIFFNKNIEQDNSLNCKHIESSLFFDCKNRIKFCPYYDETIVDENLDGIWLNIDKIEQKRQEFKNHPPKRCMNCKFKEIGNNKKELNSLQTIYLANWHFCYVNCNYCKYPKQEDLIAAKHYDVFPFFKELMDKKLITKKTKVVFECGDACVHPEFDKIMFYLLNMEFENVEVNTSAQRYCESIAQGINKGTTNLTVSFDSGCQYIYHKIKQINKFDIAVSNVKRYLKYQMPSTKNVILKYNIISGINDNKKEPLDLFIFARDMGVNKLIFDIEPDFYEKSLHHIPQHIREIMMFLKDMAKYNFYDIAFGKRLQVLYDLMKTT